MFNNRKNDPLIDSVKAVMEQNELFRQIEQELLEEYGVVSRKALPHEILPEFDAVLAEAKKCAMEELKGEQHKIDANKNNKIDAHDFKLLRSKKKMGLDEETPADEGRRAAGYKGKTPGEQGEIAAKNDDEMRAKLKKGAVVHHEGVPHVVRKVEGDDITIQKMHGKAAYPKVVSMSKITKVTGETVPMEESDQLDGTEESDQLDGPDNEKIDYKAPGVKKLKDGKYWAKSQSGTMRIFNSEKAAIRHSKSNMDEQAEQLDEKAVSKAQHRFFGLVRGIQKGKAEGSEKAEKAAKEMTVKQVRDYAKTKEKGLPERVDEEKLTGGAKAAWQMGERHGAKGSAKFSDKQLEKSFGEYAKHYHRGYESASDNREWREKQQDRRLREDIDSIMEEIRNNLEEQLVAVYESGDEEAFTEFVDSLTEEQAEILGLNEQVVPGRGLPPSAMSTYGAKAKEKLANIDRPAPKPATQPVRSNVAQSGGTGAGPSAVGVPPLSNQRPVKTATSTAPTPTKVMPKAKPMAPTRPAPAARPPSVQKPRPAGGAAAAQKRIGYSTTRAGASAGETMMANLVREETEKPQIKESFEHFIRNKFLKD